MQAAAVHAQRHRRSGTAGGSGTGDGPGRTETGPGRPVPRKPDRTREDQSPGRISLMRHVPSTATRTRRSWRLVVAGPVPTTEPPASFSSYAEELERTCTRARAAVAPSSTCSSARVLENPARTWPELRSRSAVRPSAAAAGEPSAFTSSSSPNSPVLNARSRRAARPWTAWRGSDARACCLATAPGPPLLPSPLSVGAPEMACVVWLAAVSRAANSLAAVPPAGLSGPCPPSGS